MKPKVAIIIVIWNGIEDTLECLRSLQNDEYPNKEIIIVDNGSSDGSAARIAEGGFVVRILKAPRNLGFTGGNNMGLAEAIRLRARYAFLLNNDTTLEPEAVSHLVAAAEECPESGILAPVMHYYDAPGDVWFAGSQLSLSRGEALHDPSARPERSEPPYTTSWVSGCAMLVRLDAVENVGGFDERFFLTWEDVDWCLRMSRAQWLVGVVPKARIFHKGGRSGAKLNGIRSYYAVRNSLLLVAKHGGVKYFRAVFCVVGRHLRSAMRCRGRDRVEILSTTWQGLCDHWLGRYGPRNETRKGAGKLRRGEPHNLQTKLGGSC